MFPQTEGVFELDEWLQVRFVSFVLNSCKDAEPRRGRVRALFYMVVPLSGGECSSSPLW